MWNIIYKNPSKYSMEKIFIVLLNIFKYIYIYNNSLQIWKIWEIFIAVS